MTEVSAHTLMLDTNCRLNSGETLSDEEKRGICATLLTYLTPPDARPARRMSSQCFVPRDNAFLPLITGYLPKTKILSSNAHELEILRLLALFDGRNSKIQEALNHTQKRLNSTCFGHFCPKGECYEISIAVLRMVKVAFPHETEWIDELESGLTRHFGDKRRPVRIREYLLTAVG